jgi:transketolase
MKYGGYIIYEPKEDLDIIIIATGSEVYLAYESIKFLEKEYNLNIRLISMPCTQLFDIQNNEYKDHILPKNIKKISIEAGCTLGWYKYANYVYGIDRFGESGKMNDLKEEFGMNVDKFSKFILDIL